MSLKIALAISCCAIALLTQGCHKDDTAAKAAAKQALALEASKWAETKCTGCWAGPKATADEVTARGCGTCPDASKNNTCSFVEKTCLSCMARLTQDPKQQCSNFWGRCQLKAGTKDDKEGTKKKACEGLFTRPLCEPKAHAAKAAAKETAKAVKVAAEVEKSADAKAKKLAENAKEAEEKAKKVAAEAKKTEEQAETVEKKERRMEETKKEEADKDAKIAKVEAKEAKVKAEEVAADAKEAAQDVKEAEQVAEKTKVIKKVTDSNAASDICQWVANKGGKAVEALAKYDDDVDMHEPQLWSEDVMSFAMMAVGMFAIAAVATVAVRRRRPEWFDDEESQFE